MKFRLSVVSIRARSAYRPSYYSAYTWKRLTSAGLYLQGSSRKNTDSFARFRQMSHGIKAPAIFIKMIFSF